MTWEFGRKSAKSRPGLAVGPSVDVDQGVVIVRPEQKGDRVVEALSIDFGHVEIDPLRQADLGGVDNQGDVSPGMLQRLAPAIGLQRKAAVRTHAANLAIEALLQTLL